MNLKMKVLVVDDEELIRNIIVEYCHNEGYLTDEACDGLEAIEKVKNNDYDIIILDLMMPKLDGYTSYRQIKDIKNIPTIVLSARSEEADKLLGFDLGVDDYMTKPFSPKELMARIRAILKRSNGSDDNLFVYKNLKVDKIGHSVIINDKEVMLTPKEYNLLIYFIDNKNVALSREQLLSKVWGYDFFGDDRTIDTHIKMLRNNLGEYRNLIKTVRAVGYKFEIKD